MELILLFQQKTSNNKIAHFMDFADYNVYLRKSVVLFQRLCLINKLDFLYQIDANRVDLLGFYSVIASKRVNKDL